ncbi:MAG TPA: hypothetical protein VE869_15510, partial [Gemmatimonas sp.]|nr:hypothetical protein [Gemmatimonas sp.]
FTGVGTLQLVSLLRMRRFSSTALAAAALIAVSGCSSADVEAPPAPADRLEFRAGPAQVTAGVPFDPPLQVVILRQDGSVDATSTAVVSLVSQSATVVDTLRGPTSLAATGGVATFSGVSLSRVSTDTRLIARTTGLTGAESAPIRVVPGEPTQLVFLSQPDAAVAGQLLPAIRVQLRDIGGNRVTSASGPVAISISTGPSGASIDGTVTGDLTAGELSFTDIRLPRAGTGYTLTATLVGGVGVRSPVTRVFTTAPAAPSELAFLTEPTASTVGFPVTPAVRVAVLDGFGNLITAASTPVTLELAVATAGTQLTGPTTVGAISGIATFSALRVDRPSSTVRLRATAPGLNPAVSAVFAVGTP